MKLVQYNPQTNIVILEIKGRFFLRELNSFIRTGQVEELSESDRAQLFALLDGHPLIVADEGLAGSHSFSILDQQPMLLLLCGLYLVLMVFCPVILPRHVHDVSGSELSLASALLALSFPLLDAVRDLYGQRRARQLRWFSMVVLLGMAGLYGLQQSYLSHLVTGNHEGTGHSHNLVAMDDFYRDFPETYVLLALALWVADSLNTLVFGKIGGLKKGGGILQNFAVRSVLSSMLAQLAFMPLVACLLQAAFWHDARFFSFVLDISLWKLLLILSCQAVVLVIVYGIRYWRRRYVKGVKPGAWSFGGSFGGSVGRKL